MAHVYFHCASADHLLPYFSEAEVADLAEAREQAAATVRAFLAVPGAEDWRDWVLHISDEAGEELFALPFTSVLGPLH